ncbi:hypothetical protein JL722_4839 [Aureococcus anophagefferens]|nr:hypothetical protein JL722_4839 [Aureococcus anophagefferens]
MRPTFATSLALWAASTTTAFHGPTRRSASYALRAEAPTKTGVGTPLFDKRVSADAPRASAVGAAESARTERLVADLQSAAGEANKQTFAGAAGRALALAVAGGLAFAPVACGLRNLVNDEGLAVLANDEGQYFQNYVNAINVFFALLLANTFNWLYGQQEQLFIALFGEVSVAKALLEQVAFVSRGRPAYAAELLGYVREYVDDDLTAIDDNPVSRLVGGEGARKRDALEHVMWLTSVGEPGHLYDSVKALREAGRRGALQRKLPLAHFALLAVLGALVLCLFPLLAAATGAAVAAGDGLLEVQAVLFALMTFAIALTLDLAYAFWVPSGSAYNVDGILRVMVAGLDAEIDDRLADARGRSGATSFRGRGALGLRAR